jgi:hypothetical protein
MRQPPTIIVGGKVSPRGPGMKDARAPRPSNYWPGIVLLLWGGYVLAADYVGSTMSAGYLVSDSVSWRMEILDRMFNITRISGLLGASALAAMVYSVHYFYRTCTKRSKLRSLAKASPDPIQSILPDFLRIATPPGRQP